MTTAAPTEPRPAPAAPVGPPMRPPPPGPRPPTAATPVQPAIKYSLADCSAEEDTIEADFQFIYGAPGTGKSSYAAGFERPYFVRVDPQGAKSLPRSVGRSRVPLTWDEQPRERFDPLKPSVMGLLRMVLDADDPPGCLVLDTINQAEALLFEYLCKQGGVDSIEKYDSGFGHGYTKSTEEMHRLIGVLNQISGRGIDIIVISHATGIKVPNPGGPEYMQWGPNLVAKTSALWMGVASTVIFAQAEGAITTKDAGKKTEKSKIQFTGRVLAHVVPGQGWYAKNRDNLPSPMVLDADVFREEARVGQDLKEQWYAEKKKLTPARRAEIGERMAIAGWSRDNMLEVIAELTATDTQNQKDQE